jgi:hypothetical protein
MTDDERIGYEVWEVRPRPQPAVTTLFPVSPCGIGTPAVESLSSYVVRLAQAHRVRVSTLVSEVVLPALVPLRKLSSDEGAHTNLWLAQAATMNGKSRQAQTWVTTLNQLTGRSDLAALTMLGWADVVATRGLLRSTRVWCPECYAAAPGGVIYERLAWSLACVTVCADHQRVLEEHCPTCGRTQRVWVPHSQPGRCSWCRAWLGQTEPAQCQDARLPPDPWQGWVAQALGALVAYPPQWKMNPSREQIQQVVKLLLARTPGRCASALARQLKTTSTAIHAWASGQCLPQLDSLLRLSACAGCSPYELLTDPQVEVTLQTAELQGVTAPVSIRRGRYQQHDPGRIREALQQILAGPAPVPLSLRDVAQQLGISTRILRLYDPEGCRAISARYKANRALQKVQRNARLIAEVQAAVADIHQSGRYPSMYQVERRLGKTGMTRAPEVRAAYHRALGDVNARRTRAGKRGAGPGHNDTTRAEACRDVPKA